MLKGVRCVQELKFMKIRVHEIFATDCAVQLCTGTSAFKVQLQLKKWRVRLRSEKKKDKNVTKA